jgi:transcriptional regulator
MTFIDAYLTPKQRTIWRLRFDGNSQSEISRRTGVTRQTVNKTLGVIDSKVTRALLEAAKVNRIDVRRLEMEGGFLLGHSNAFDLDAMVTYSDENGIQVWYRGEGDCGTCDEYASCKSALLREADVRGIELPEDVDALEPSRLADIIFEGLTGETH